MKKNIELTINIFTKSQGGIRDPGSLISPNTIFEIIPLFCVPYLQRKLHHNFCVTSIYAYHYLKNELFHSVNSQAL